MNVGGPPPQELTSLKRTSQALGLLAGAATVIYVAGGWCSR